MDLNDTIVALSSAPGAAARAVVRMTGPGATRILGGLAPGFDLDPIARRQVVSANIPLPNLASAWPADIFLLRAPTTYTGQDLVEFHVVSCPPLVDLLIAELLRLGARAALAGEFTMRAFLAGKLDLTRAEAVHAVIEAGSAVELKQALTQLAGGVADPLALLREDLLNLLADVEAGLDFTEEDLQFVENAELLRRLTKGLAQVTLVSKQLRDRAVSGPAFRVVLAGPANAGKSSLFNALLNRDAVLVGPEAGTTRDYVEADLALDGVVARLVDTAGLGESRDSLDLRAQELGRSQTAAADLVLWCGEEAPIGAIRLSTKCDLDPASAFGMRVSSVTGEGLASLRNAIRDRAAQRVHSALAPSLSRCRQHVAACLTHLRRAHHCVLEGDPAEIVAVEIRVALDELGAMVGAVHTDDLLDRIFSRFCVGK